MHDLSSSYIGVDSGGTSTRVLVARADGTVIGTGRGPGANIWSSGAPAAGVISDVIASALGNTDRSVIAHGVIAVAGGTGTQPKAVERVVSAWQTLDLPGTPDIVPDVLAAYAAGTTATHGVVLAAGTGAIAARIADWDIANRAGGHGWMVGDEGSAVWLGLEAVRAALHALDGRGPSTPLADVIADDLGARGIDDRDTCQRIISAVYTSPPASFGRFAPLVVETCRAGDEVSRSLVEAAAEHLFATALAVSDGPPPVLVLAGSMLTKAVAIGSRVRAKVEAAWPETVISEAMSGEAGAVALAIQRHTGTAITDDVLTLLASNPDERGTD
ncbi:MAG: BadF/BadG/BcrA/BcrD ATPase family protein [Actinomycetota bacterium]